MSFERESRCINRWLPGESKKKGIILSVIIGLIIGLPHICEKQQVPKVCQKC